MSRRTTILTEIIAPYRIPVFNALAQDKAVDLHVVFLSETDAKLRQWRVYSDEIRFSYEVLRSKRISLGTSKFLFNWGLRRSLSRFSPESIICGGYNYATSWEALMWARQHKAAFLLWSESNGQDQRSGRAFVELLKGYFVRHCNGFIVPGQASREYLRSFGASEEHIFTAPNAVDSDFFGVEASKVLVQKAFFREQLRVPERFILYVGRLLPEKGIFDLLEAYAKLDEKLRSEVGLVFVGDGISRCDLVQRATSISPGMISCPGFVHREGLAGFYALADVLVLPTHSDTWGLVVNEAMACGLPIIATSVAGCVADLVEDGWNGHVVPPHDPDRLNVALCSVLRQPNLRLQMKAHSAERIRKYSPQACAEGMAIAVASTRIEMR